MKNMNEIGFVCEYEVDTEAPVEDLLQDAEFWLDSGLAVLKTIPAAAVAEGMKPVELQTLIFSALNLLEMGRGVIRRSAAEVHREASVG